MPGSPFRDMTKEERDLSQALIDDVHEAVRRSRVARIGPWHKETVKGFADAPYLHGASGHGTQARRDGDLDQAAGVGGPPGQSWTASRTRSILRKNGGFRLGG